ALERLAAVLEMALLGEPLQPAHPLLHDLLHLLGRAVGTLLAAAVQIDEFAHDDSPSWSACETHMLATCLTSTAPPPSSIGQPFASSAACDRSRARISV